MSSVLDLPQHEMSLRLIGVTSTTDFIEVRQKYNQMIVALEKSEEISKELGCTPEE